MPSSIPSPIPIPIASFPEFDRRLTHARAAMDALVASHPGERELLSIQKQLEALHAWTRGGTAPSQAQKDTLNFGLLASRAVDDLDAALADTLYALASFVTYG